MNKMAPVLHSSLGPHLLQSDFAAPPTKRWSQFPQPLGLGWPWGLLWPRACGGRMVCQLQACGALPFSFPLSHGPVTAVRTSLAFSTEDERRFGAAAGPTVPAKASDA